MHETPRNRLSGRLFGVGLTLSLAFGLLADDRSAPARKDRGWIEQRVAQWQPTKEERAFETIGWAKDLLEATRLAKQHNRGIFLFTYDGESLAGYRC